MRFTGLPVTHPRRRAFTLTEMLVVIAIIVILTGLLSSGVFVWMSKQQGRTTEGNMRTVNKVLQEQWAYVVEQAKKESPSSAVVSLATYNGAFPDPGGERARVLWIKVRLIEAFPQAYSEVNNNSSGTDPVFNAL
jgi:prepilin-type N-terminal cleavage/methylation domain-containing protein